jgi:hypothetical protein
VGVEMAKGLWRLCGGVEDAAAQKPWCMAQQRHRGSFENGAEASHIASVRWPFMGGIEAVFMMVRIGGCVQHLRCCHSGQHVWRATIRCGNCACVVRSYGGVA